MLELFRRPYADSNQGSKLAMQISVKSDVDEVLKSMRSLQRKQMPFAAALGLTMTAKKVAKVEQRMRSANWHSQHPLRLK